MAWKIAQVRWNDADRLNGFLGSSWEPFAVSQDEDGATVWLRRSAEPADAQIEDLPRRPRHEPQVADVVRKGDPH